VTVLGLDLSLSRSAAVVMPVPGFERVHAWVAETDYRGQVLLHRMAKWIDLVAEESGATSAFFEQHVIMRGAVLQAHALERIELVGALKLTLARRGIPVIAVVASSARKLLFGKLPRMKRPEIKKFVRHELRRMGAPETILAGEDEADAFVIANAGRHALGLPCFSVDGDSPR
jgi:hypothetical protein